MLTAGRFVAFLVVLIVLASCGSGDESSPEAPEQTAQIDANDQTDSEDGGVGSDGFVPEDCSTLLDITDVDVSGLELQSERVDNELGDTSCWWDDPADTSSKRYFRIDVGWDLPSIEDARATVTRMELTPVESSRLDQLGAAAWTFQEPQLDTHIRLAYRDIHTIYIDLEQGTDGPANLLDAAERLATRFAG